MAEKTSPALKVTKREQEGILVLDLVGDLDNRTAWVARDEIKSALEKGQNRILINLENVSYIDSAGLGLLVSALKGARERGGGVYLSGLTAQVRMVIELTRLHRVFLIFDSVEKALETLTQPGFAEPVE